MTTNWLERKAAQACGRSKCNDCSQLKGANMMYCNICMKAWQKGYKAGYKARKPKRKT